MKSITIKHKSCWRFFGQDDSEIGFTISYNDYEEEATIFNLSEDENSKLIPKVGLEKLWKKLMEVNFQKVLLENEVFQGCDGGFSIVELSVGLQTLTLSLWSPDEKFYKKNNLPESLKLLKVVRKLVNFANSHNVAVGYEF